MTVLLPRDKNASRNVDAPHIAKARPQATSDGNVTPNKNTKKVFIKTYGCQMNVYDSERMADVLAPILSLIHI